MRKQKNLCFYVFIDIRISDFLQKNTNEKKTLWHMFTKFRQKSRPYAVSKKMKINCFMVMRYAYRHYEIMTCVHYH